MQRSLAHLSAKFLPPVCSIVLNPTGRFFSRSIFVIASRSKYLFGNGSNIRSVLLLNSYRNYVRGVNRSGERPGSSSKNDAIAPSKKITKLGKEEKLTEILRQIEKEEYRVQITKLIQEGNRKEILRLAEREKNRLDNVIWSTAFSQLGQTRNVDRGDPLFEAFVKEYAACLESRGLQWAGIREVANVVYVIGKTKLKNPGTKSILSFVSKKENARKMVREGNARDVANVAWSFATLDDPTTTTLFAEIETRADWLATNGNPQDLANVAWAFAKLGVECHNRFFAEIETRADWLVTNGTPQAVANAAWAFATLVVRCPKLFAEIETRADWLVTNGTPQAVANTIWAASQFRYYAPKLMEETNLRGAWLVKEGSIQHISNSAMAFANHGYDASIFFTALANNASKLINDDGNPQGIINVCYAMAVLDLGKKYPDAFCRLWNAAINLDTAMLRNEELSQIGQVLAFCTAGRMKLQQPSILLTRKIGAVVQGLTRSKYQREVATILEQLGLDCEEEVSPLEGSETNNNMLSIDIVCKSHTLAIECDGEFHFLQELGTGKVLQRENGATTAKRRFLQRTGWNVVNIDYRDWMDARQKNRLPEFLRGKLKQGGIQL